MIIKNITYSKGTVGIDIGDVIYRMSAMKFLNYVNTGIRNVEDELFNIISLTEIEEYYTGNYGMSALSGNVFKDTERAVLQSCLHHQGTRYVDSNRYEIYFCGPTQITFEMVKKLLVLIEVLTDENVGELTEVRDIQVIKFSAEKEMAKYIPADMLKNCGGNIFLATMLYSMTNPDLFEEARDKLVEKLRELEKEL